MFISREPGGQALKPVSKSGGFLQAPGNSEFKKWSNETISGFCL
jgi:hypothetical protein